MQSPLSNIPTLHTRTSDAAGMAGGSYCDHRLRHAHAGGRSAASHSASLLPPLPDDRAASRRRPDRPHESACTAKPSVLGQEDRLRELASGLRQLVRELQRSDAALRSRVVIASQHAITTSITPHVLRNFLPSGVSFRLRSANREECYALVMTRQADLALCYQRPGDRFAAIDAILEELDLGTERFIPVFSRVELGRLEESCRQGECPIISYPRDVFLGRRFEQEILPRMPASFTLARRAETALTLAALQLALVGSPGFPGCRSPWSSGTSHRARWPAYPPGCPRASWAWQRCAPTSVAAAPRPRRWFGRVSAQLGNLALLTTSARDPA